MTFDKNLKYGGSILAILWCSSSVAGAAQDEDEKISIEPNFSSLAEAESRVNEQSTALDIITNSRIKEVQSQSLFSEQDKAKIIKDLKSETVVQKRLLILNQQSKPSAASKNASAGTDKATSLKDKYDKGKKKYDDLKEKYDLAKEVYTDIGSNILKGDYDKAIENSGKLAKKKAIEKVEKAFEKKYGKSYKVYKLGKEIKDDMLKGDYGEAWNKTKETAKKEAIEYVEKKILEKAIPGYGQLKTAWDFSQVAGTWLGKQSLSADGKTINQLAEEQMSSTFFSAKDNKTAKENAQAEIILALTKSVKNGEYKLPNHMKFSDAVEIIRDNVSTNRSPFDGFRAWAANEISDADVTDASIVAPVYKNGVVTVPKPQSPPSVSVPTTETPKVTEPETVDPWGTPSDPVTNIPEPENIDKPESDAWAEDAEENTNLDNQRYLLEQQLEAEKSRTQAIANNRTRRQFAAVQAKREEEARIKEQKRRELQEGLAAFAQGLGQIAQQIQQEKQASNQRAAARLDQRQEAQKSAFQFGNFMKKCRQNSKLGRYDDPHIAEMKCRNSYQASTSGSSQTATPSSSYNNNYGTSATGGSNYNSNTDRNAPNFNGLINSSDRNSGSYEQANNTSNSYGSSGDWGVEEPVPQASTIYTGDPTGYYEDTDKMQMICGVDVKRGGWKVSARHNYSYILSKPSLAKSSSSSSRGVLAPRMTFYSNCQQEQVLTQTGGDTYTNKYWYKNGNVRFEGEYWSMNWAKVSKEYRKDGSLKEVTTSTGADLKKQYGVKVTKYQRDGKVTVTEY